MCDAAGFETVTYVLPGKKGLVHRDSLGCKMSYGEGEAMHGLRKGRSKIEVWAEGELEREARGERERQVEMERMDGCGREGMNSAGEGEESCRDGWAVREVGRAGGRE